MSTVMEEEFKRWTAKRKAALITEIIQGKTSVAEASRSYTALVRSYGLKQEFTHRTVRSRTA